MRRNSSCHAFSLAELLVVICILGALLFFLGYRYRESRARAQEIRCTSHLKQIGLAFKTFAIDHSNAFPFELSITNGGVRERMGNAWPAFSVMSNELSTPKILVCPGDPERKAATNFLSRSDALSGTLSDQSLSYFVGIDATEAMPNVFLSGDRFVGFDGKRLPPGLHTVVTNQQISWINSWHYQTMGNVLLSDGSVQQATFTRLQQIFEDGNLATNRLVIP